jgi:uncharacterized Zn finger protein (UPF0148 family)
MKEKTAKEFGYRCPKCGTPLEQSRGDYYCPLVVIGECKTIEPLGSQLMSERY